MDRILETTLALRRRSKHLRRFLSGVDAAIQSGEKSAILQGLQRIDEAVLGAEEGAYLFEPKQLAVETVPKIAFAAAGDVKAQLSLLEKGLSIGVEWLVDTLGRRQVSLLRNLANMTLRLPRHEKLVEEVLRYEITDYDRFYLRWLSRSEDIEFSIPSTKTSD
jgi:hypothetical protein